MSVVRLDEDDLDEEDLAILKEVAKKGYYHNRPKSESCATPQRVEEVSDSKTPELKGRAAFDAFQAKWDRFDNEEYLEAVIDEIGERFTGGTKDSTPSDSAQRSLRHVAEFKILLIGERAVGKTSFLLRHQTGEFSRSGAARDTEVVSLRFATTCGEIVFNVWELNPSAEERGFGQGQAAILMYDMGSRASWRSVPNRLRDIRKFCGSIPVVLVGNKTDVGAQWKEQTRSARIAFQQKRRLQHFETSAKTCYNLEKPFWWLSRRLSGCPSLELASRRAVLPEVHLQAELFAQHGRELAEAARTPVPEALADTELVFGLEDAKFTSDEVKEKVKVAQATEAIAAVGHVPDAAKKNRELKTYSLDAFVMVVTRAVSLVTLRKVKEISRYEMLTYQLRITRSSGLVSQLMSRSLAWLTLVGKVLLASITEVPDHVLEARIENSLKVSVEDLFLAAGRRYEPLFSREQLESVLEDTNCYPVLPPPTPQLERESRITLQSGKLTSLAAPSEGMGRFPDFPEIPVFSKVEVLEAVSMATGTSEWSQMPPLSGKAFASVAALEAVLGLFLGLLERTDFNPGLAACLMTPLGRKLQETMLTVLGDHQKLTSEVDGYAEWYGYAEAEGCNAQLIRPKSKDAFQEWFGYPDEEVAPATTMYLPDRDPGEPGDGDGDREEHDHSQRLAMEATEMSLALVQSAIEDRRNQLACKQGEEAEQLRQEIYELKQQQTRLARAVFVNDMRWQLAAFRRLAHARYGLQWHADTALHVAAQAGWTLFHLAKLDGYFFQRLGLHEQTLGDSQENFTDALPLLWQEPSEVDLEGDVQTDWALELRSALHSGGSLWHLDKGLLRFLLSMVLRKGDNVCDLGAFGGHYSEWLNDTGLVSAYAFDAIPGVEEITKGAVRHARLDVQHLELVDAGCDVVLCLEVMEHILPSLEQQALSNLGLHTKRALVLSWAPPWVPGPGHINQRPPEEAWAVVERQTGLARQPILSEGAQASSSLSWVRESVSIFTWPQPNEKRTPTVEQMDVEGDSKEDIGLPEQASQDDAGADAVAKSEEEEEEEEIVELTGQELTNRVKQLEGVVTFAVFAYLRRGLLDADKLTVASMLALKILVRSGEVHPEELNILIRAPVDPLASPMPDTTRSWLTEHQWAQLKTLEQISVFKTGSNALTSTLEQDSLGWKRWFAEEKAEAADLPRACRELSTFHRLFLLRVLRPDRIGIDDDLMLRRFLPGVTIKHLVKSMCGLKAIASTDHPLISCMTPARLSMYQPGHGHGL
ncbi:GSP1 [Symbiodinium sp. KB8]|nr:GSP1 [Symbiodinium sp. KB8]